VKRTILFATEYWRPWEPGGAERTNEAWAQALGRRGHRVIVVTPSYGDAPPREDADGVTVLRERLPVRSRRWHLPEGQVDAPWLLFRNPLFHAWFARVIGRAAAADDVDVVHAQTKVALVGARRAARVLRLPLAVTVRDIGLLCPIGGCTIFESRATYDCSIAQYAGKCAPWFLERYHGDDGRLRRARRWASLLVAWRDHLAQRRAVARADVVIGVSRGILDVHPSDIADPRRSRVVYSLPPRVPGDLESPAEVRKRLGIGDGPLVLYAGKRSPGKGTDVLVAALGAIRAGVPGVRFAFAGKGEIAPPPSPDVHVLGSVPQATLFALYRAADLVVAPAVWPEPLSRVLLEATAFGRPIVATDVGGNREIVEDGVTGVLVKRGAPADLARGVVDLLRDPDRRARFSAAGPLRAARVFAEDRLVDELLEAYESAIARHGATR
jgi:glycosyltransferase involved in cell wall biosynthesis